jgi:sulfite exporter TauE/SafE
MMIAAFLFGFFGSLHCVAMCGPIVLALAPKADESSTSGARWKRAARFLASKLLYNAGRVSLYVALGLALGASAEILGAAVFDIHGYQEALSLSVGALMLLTVALAFAQRSAKARDFFGARFSSSVLQRASSRLYQYLRGKLNARIRASRYGGQFLLGALNGFLPCGFVYMALAMAATAGTTAGAAKTMALFGLGTVPAMAFTAIFSERVAAKLSALASARRLLPLGTIIIAAFFIARGLALDIPYLSPKLSAQPSGTEQGCHSSQAK